MTIRALDEDRETTVFTRDRVPREVTPEDDPAFSDVFMAFMRSETTVGSILANGLPDYSIDDPDYDPFQNIEGYETDINAFLFADTDKEVAQAKRQVDRERADRDLWHRATGTQKVALFASGFLDPIMLFPVGGTIMRARSLGRLARAVGTAKVGFGVSAASEGILQATQHTRTLGESIGVISASTLMSGVLGSLLPVIPKGVMNDAMTRIEHDFAPEGAVAGGKSLDTVITDAEIMGGAVEAKLKSSLGIAEFSGAFLRANPKLRTLVNTRSPVTFRTVRRLVEIAPRITDEAKVKSPVSVWNRVLGWNARLGAGLAEADKQFVLHRTGKADGGIRARAKITLADQFRRGSDDGNLTRKKFNEEAGRAFAYGDVHDIPEVAATARAFRKELTDVAQERLQAQGRLPVSHQETERILVKKKGKAGESAGRRTNTVERVPESATFSPEIPGSNLRGTALSWMHRVYKPYEMVAKENEFLTETRRWVLSQHPELEKQLGVDGSFEEANVIANQIFESIMGLNGGRLNVAPIPFTNTKVLKERVFDIPDEILDRLGVLDRDIDTIMRHYTRSVAPEIEMFEEFGSLDLADVGKAIIKSYRKLQDDVLPGPKQAKEKNHLKKLMDNDLKEIADMRDMVLGTYGAPAHPQAAWTRVGHAIKRINFAAIGGGFGLNAIPDVGRLVQVHGLQRTFHTAIRPLFTDLEAIKIGKRETNLAGEAYELVKDARAQSIGDINDHFSGSTRPERFLDSVARTSSVISGLAPWNVAAKSVAGVMTQTRIFQAGSKILRGKHVAKKEMETMRHLGLDEELLQKIASQPWEQRSALHLSNTEQWSDIVALDAYRAALRKHVNETIVTPGPGDVPSLFSTQMGGLLFQFQSFGHASVNQTLIPALQQRDFVTLNGAMVSVAMGMVVFALKEKLAGRELPDPDDMRWWFEGWDRSGQFGVFSNYENMAEKLTRGAIGVNPLISNVLGHMGVEKTGAHILSRYQQRNLMGSFFGPTFGLASNVAQVIGAASSGDFTQNDTHKLRQMLPYQRVFYATQLFDKVEEGANDLFGIPKRSRKK